MGDQDVRVQAGRNLRAGTVADSGSGNGSNGTGGNNGNTGGNGGNNGSNGSGNNGGNTGSTGGNAGTAQARATARAQAQHRDRRQHAIGRPGLRQGRADAASRPRHPAAGQISAARTLQAEAGGELSTTPARACNRARPWGYARARA